MSLSISTYVIGPIQNNCYLAFDPDSKEAVIIDPPAGAKIVLKEVQQKALNLKAIWITHAHFDHFAGAAELAAGADTPLPVGLHRKELALYQNNGGASFFGYQIPPQPEPSLFFEHGQMLSIGIYPAEVRHCPGHSSGGQIIYYVPEASVAFVGDVIFRRSIGRTDLPGGDHAALLHSIRTQIMTLPPETQLLCGHGDPTSVAEEAAHNPFL
ncbi:MAG: MBL fold metallo-hydrolase [Anaerolineaceae bacterium]|jgi:glyoxylase-like metal-dependent hydrolase (beta-lactamase superfamily II)|nr:MBL fold metallo-hydrolase [Anaerolineaceae bacterium]